VFLTTIEGNVEALVVSTILPWFTLVVFVVMTLAERKARILALRRSVE
jgi:hypothetical protein